MDDHFLGLGGAEVRIASKGAELQRLRLGGRELLWDAGPLWPRHAPLLFPIVGGLMGDAFRHEGATFPLPRHGFARERDFAWLRREAASCALELRDDAASRAVYPFAFRLEVAYDLEPRRLCMTLCLENPSDGPLPASLGLHPAFRWPLAPDLPKAAHRLVFEAGEPGPLRRLDARGLLHPETLATPIRNRQLALEEALFSEDALIFLEPRSQGLRFEAEGGPALSLRWEGFPHLGLWAKPEPGPSFLCIEPWEGHASPADWDAEFTEKPGSFLLGLAAPAVGPSPLDWNPKPDTDERSELEKRKSHHQGTKNTKNTKNCRGTYSGFSWCLLGIRNADTRDKFTSGVLVVILIRPM